MPRTYLQNVEFEQIKESLKDFLRDPNFGGDFSDYDFEGSNLSVIVNLLAYTAHYHAVYSNFVLNESFMRTAHTRASVVSKAKDVGYTPRSRIAPTMIVDFTMRDIDGDPSFYTLPRGTKFRTKIDDREYTFLVTEDVSTPRVNGEYRFEDLKLREGKLKTFRYNVNSDNVRDLFEIPDRNVDTELLRVIVRDNPDSSNERQFVKAPSIVDLDRDSRVYWVQEGPSGKYEIEFGDDIISKGLEDGNLVRLNWVNTRGSETNGANNVTPDFTIAGGYDYDIEVTTPAFGGNEKENVDSIKFSAPKSFAKQNRVVTAEDYYTELKENVGDLRDLNVWGGEDNDPPQYGKVFIVLETDEGSLTRGATADIDARILRPKRMPTVITEFVDPNYINPNLTVSAIYNPTETSLTRDDITQRIENSIHEFINDEARKFGTRVFLSQLETEIQNLVTPDFQEDESISSAYAIKSVSTDITLTISKSVRTNTPIFLEYKFGNEIKPESVQSNRFITIERFQERDARIVDNGTGGLYLYDISEERRTSQRVGDVNYSQGKITITDLRLASIFRGLTELFITVDPENPRDLRAQRDQIFAFGDYSRDLVANIPSPLTINLSII